MTTFKCAQWRDCALLLDGGSVVVHKFTCPDIKNVIKSKTDIILISDLASFVSGRRGRIVSGFSMYWYVHSEIIYVLTGIVHCHKIYIECGKPLANDVHEIYTIPKIFLIRNDLKAIELKWNINIQFNMVHLSVTSHLPCTLLQYKSTFEIPYDFFKGDELDIFRDKISSAYLCITQHMCMFSESELQMVNRCYKLAKEKQIFIISGTQIENFFLAQVGLYELNGGGFLEEILGSIRKRNTLINSDFILHRKALHNAYGIARIFNSIYENRTLLPDSEIRDDELMIPISKYYENFIDIKHSVISMAVKTLRLLYSNWSFENTISFLKSMISVTADVSKDDVIRVFKL